MKCFIEMLKKDGLWIQAFTLYSDKGVILHKEGQVYRPSRSLKFDKDLDVILWATKKLKLLGQYGTITESEDLHIFIKSKTVYKWVITERSPKEYIIKLNDLLLEISLIVNKVDLIRSESSKTLMPNLDMETTKVTDMFK